MSSSKTAPDLPKNIDRYQVRALLGGGTFGTVYRAFDPRLDREIALKVLRPEMTTSIQAVERFLREAKAAAKLFHPHIVPVYDAGRAGTEFYIASAFIQGKTLAAAIPKGGMEAHRAAELAAQLALALAYAHRQGVLHRDVKPANIMVDEQGALYLMDFGLAAWLQEEGTRLTQDGAMMGTPAYMAPEQASGDNANVGPAADLYSAGVVLYELLTGRRPFEGHPAALVYQIVNKAAAAPSQHRLGLDRQLDAICMKALAKDPAQRYLKGEEMAKALRSLPPPAMLSTETEPTFATQHSDTLGAGKSRPYVRTSKREPVRSDPSSEATPGPSATPADSVRPRGGSRLPWTLSGLASVTVLLILAGVALVFSLLSPVGQATKDAPVVHNATAPAEVAPPRTEPPPPSETIVSGKLVDVVGDRLTFTADGKERAVTIPADATVLIDGKDGKLDVWWAIDSSVALTSRGNVVTRVEVKSPTVPLERIVVGKCVGVDKDKLTMAVDGKEMTFTVAAAATVTINDQDSKLSDIKKNSIVSITREGDRVGKVKAKSPPPPPAPAKAPFDATEATRVQRAWADYLGVSVEQEVKLPGFTMKLMLVPPGEFTMGSPKVEEGDIDDKPRHKVEITRPYYLGAFAVTRGQFADFVYDAGYQTEGEKAGHANTWRDPGFASYNQTDNDPVVEVTWNDAVKFSQWLSKEEKRTYELPTEAEWEHACRAGTTTDFSFGDNPKTLDDYAWYGKTFGHTHPVGEKKPNPWGLFDMHGNVWQWCADSYDVAYYNNSRNKDPENTVKSGARVLRGGSYDDASGHCRSASRYWNAPADPLINLGFRVRVRLD